MTCVHDCANCEVKGCKSEIFERRGEWSGYTVRKTPKGFLVSRWSRIQGQLTDRKELVPYGRMAYGYGPQTSLFAAHNAHTMVGQAIAEYCTGNAGCKVLRKGHIVQ